MLKLLITLQTMFIAAKDRVTGDDERGATATEYALLVGLIALVIAGGVLLFGQALLAWFNNLTTQLGTWH